MSEARKAKQGKGPVVVDELRPQHPLWRVAMVVAWAAVLASACAMVWARHQARQQFQVLQELQRERDELNIEWNQLRLELGALAAHWRVERLAREQLSMREPQISDMRWAGEEDEDE